MEDKISVVVASLLSGGGFWNIVTNDNVLSLVERGLSITSLTVGLSYLLWKWCKDWRFSKRTDRRKDDPC